MNGPIEPAANLRQIAATLHQTFLAFVQEGFTEHQALVVLGQLLADRLTAAQEDM